MRYRRSLIANATYFFTINLQNRSSSLLTERIEELKLSIRKVKAGHPFYIDSIVILPDHFHIMMTMPEGDYNYSKRISLIKSNFSRQIEPVETISNSRKKKRERGIWQRRYWEHLIQNEKDYEHHVNYIHYNPVKHGYVLNPMEWKYSSIHRFIRKGVINSSWATNHYFKDICFGE